VGIYSSVVYRHSPVLLQEALLSLRAAARSFLRERGSRDIDDELLKAEQMNPDEVVALQIRRLRETLVHASDHVPFYRRRFSEHRFDPRGLTSLEDLRAVPFLTRKEVIEAGTSMLSDDHKGLRFSASTSGTTGVPLTAWRGLTCVRWENAFVGRQLRWAGLKAGDRRVWLRGDKIVPGDRATPPYWRHVFVDRMLMMSSYHLGEATARGYLDAMTRFDPAAIQAYPSSIFLLARYLLDKGKRYRGRSLRAVVTSSETVTDEMRRTVEEAFGCRLYDFYGSMERVICIGTCEHGRYHVMPDYSYPEFVADAAGNLEAVGTSFHNDLMPWVRYRLGDVIVPASLSRTCECGRAFPLIESVVGRIEDSIITVDGRHVFMASNILDYIPRLMQGQIRQDRAGEVRLLLVMAPGDTVDARQVERAARGYLGEAMVVHVEQVASLPRTPNGKLQMVVRSYRPASS
jgi:phenylacetate-CoA ligase